LVDEEKKGRAWLLLFMHFYQITAQQPVHTLLSFAVGKVTALCPNSKIIFLEHTQITAQFIRERERGSDN
jgi:hypothetical protein